MRRHLCTIQTTAALAADGVLPDSIEWMPAGEHTVNARVNGKPGKIKVVASEEIVATLNAQLSDRLDKAESGEAARPFVDFDHANGAAAAIPVEFYWDNGIRLRLEWTAAGREAIEGRNYSYFSPEFILDKKSGEPVGIPATGAIGSLVNAPAFQTIERIAASDATVTSKSIDAMWLDEIIKILIDLGLISKEDAENKVAENAKKRLDEMLAQAKQAKDLAAELETVKASLQTEADAHAALKAQAAEVRKATITAAVDAMVEAKRVAPEGKDALVAACIAAPDDGKALLAAIPQTVAAQQPADGHGEPLNTISGGAELTGLARVRAAFTRK